MNSFQWRGAAPRAPEAHADKQTHKLRPQTCVIWVPCCGYVALLSPKSFRAVEHPSLACHLTEDDAEVMAAQVRAQLGLRAAIRPYYAGAAG